MPDLCNLSLTIYGGGKQVRLFEHTCPPHMLKQPRLRKVTYFSIRSLM